MQLMSLYLCPRWRNKSDLFYLFIYIGHTTTTVKERIKQHSSIKRHHRETHLENITGSRILPDISILAKTSNKIDLIILEALLIKQYKPVINIQTDNFNRTLNIF